MIDFREQAIQIIDRSYRLKEKLKNDDDLIDHLQQATSAITDSLRDGNKLLICGNGGSAADAQHIAAEFTGKYLYDRPPIFAEALTVNSSYLTAVANDYHYDDVFSRMVEAKGRPSDILMCISTSGNSTNVIKAAKVARDKQLSVLGMTGAAGGELEAYCNWILKVPSTETPRIQECHILLGHIICEIVEQDLYPRNEQL